MPRDFPPAMVVALVGTVSWAIVTVVLGFPFVRAWAKRMEQRNAPVLTADVSSRLARIEEGIRRKLGDDFQITFREVNDVEKTPGGKHRWLVSKLPEAGTTAG